jgi:uncharacterized membrane protein YdbT with pleckstrin-like domain
MNPQQPQQTQPPQQYQQPLNGQPVKNPLMAMADGEVTIFSVRRHSFGLIGMYISFGLLLAIIAALAVIAPSVLTDVDKKLVSQIGLVAFLVAVVFCGVVGVIAHIVYYGNSWILTSDSLTQMNQKSLFDKQNSQLSLGNLEDISAHQDGILSHVFGYGTLKVETAGEHSKFFLTYCPKPNEYAQKILMAREAFERGEYNNGQPAAYPSGVNTNVQQ